MFDRSTLRTDTLICTGPERGFLNILVVVVTSHLEELLLKPAHTASWFCCAQSWHENTMKFKGEKQRA